MSNNWIYGCVASIVGSVFSNLGVNIQKFAAMQEADKPLDEQRSYCSQPLWHLGLWLVIVGAIADFVALGLAAQSIVAPIGSTTLVANVFFAYFWLGENLGRSDLLGTCLVILGSVLSVAFGNHEDKEFTMDDIKYFYSLAPFIVYLVVLIVTLIVAYIVVKRLEPMREHLCLQYLKYDEAVEAKDKVAVQQCKEEIDNANAVYKPYEKWHPLLYCALSGLFGGESVLMAKTFSILVRATMDGHNQFTQGLTYVFLIVMVATIVLQTHYLATSLKHFDALYVVPVFQCFWILGSTVGGAIFYQELKDFGVLQGIMFPLGIVVTLSGVYVMSNRDMSRKQEAEFEELETEEQASDTELKTIHSGTAPTLQQMGMASGEAAAVAAVASADNVHLHVSQDADATDTHAPEVPETMKVSMLKRRSMITQQAKYLSTEHDDAAPSSAAPLSGGGLKGKRKSMMLQITVPMPASAFSGPLSGGQTMPMSGGRSSAVQIPMSGGRSGALGVGSAGSVVGSMLVDQIGPLFSSLFSLTEGTQESEDKEEEAIIVRRVHHRRHSIAGHVDAPLTEPTPHRPATLGSSSLVPAPASEPHSTMRQKSRTESDVDSVRPVSIADLKRSSVGDEHVLDAVQKAAIAEGDTESYQQL